MKRSATDLVKQYVKRLNDHDLDMLSSRLTERLGGDLAECVYFFQKSPEIDRWLLSASDNGEFYSMIDLIQDCIVTETNRRFTVNR